MAFLIPCYVALGVEVGLGLASLGAQLRCAALQSAGWRDAGMGPLGDDAQVPHGMSISVVSTLYHWTVANAVVWRGHGVVKGKAVAMAIVYGYS